MHWIYILRCENGQIYVGETTRLFRRFWEHEAGEGGVNTRIMGVEGILAIYKVIDLGRFLSYHEMTIDPEMEYTRYVFSDKFDDDDLDYDAKDIENSMAEKLMIMKGEDWQAVRGGTYVRFGVEYQQPTTSLLDVVPTCKCGLPCDVKINEEQGVFYFRCPSKNFWNEIRTEFDLENVAVCDFYQPYRLDAEKCSAWKEKGKDRAIALGNAVRASPWLQNVPTFNDVGSCIGCKSKTKKMIKHPFPTGPIRAVCCDCLIEKSDLIQKRLPAKDPEPEHRGPRLLVRPKGL